MTDATAKAGAYMGQYRISRRQSKYAEKTGTRNERSRDTGFFMTKFTVHNSYVLTVHPLSGEKHKLDCQLGRLIKKNNFPDSGH